MQISAEPALTGLPRASSPIGFDGMVLRRLPSISSSGRPAASTSFTYPNARFSSPPLEGAQHSHVGLRQAGPASHGVGVTVAEGAIPSPCGLNALANGAPQNNRASTPSDSTGDVQIEDQFSDEHARGQAESWSNSLLAQSLSNGNKAFDTLSALSSPIPGSAIKAHPAWKWPGANSQALQTQCPWPGAWAVPVATSPPPSGAAANPTTPGTVTSRASYLTQEQLLPSLLLSNDEPSLHLQQPTATSAATWPINPNPPMRMNSGKLKLPSGLPPLAAAVAAAERDGLQSQGQNLMAAAGAAVRELRAAGNGQQQQTHQVAGIQMLSSLLENLPPEELEALANLDTSQFDQLMLTAASKLTKAWDTPSSTSSHLTSPTTNPLSTPPAVMRTAPLAGTKLQSSNNGTYPDPHNQGSTAHS